MLGWSINLFRIRGIQLALHGSFALLLAYVAWDGAQHGGMPGLTWSVVMLIGFFACVVLHELGHSFTAMRFGIGVRRILLMPIGGMAEFDAIPRQPSRELLITLAGPAVNFVIAGLLWFVVRNFDDDTAPYSLDGFLQQLFVANLWMGCFNLLPSFPMDGGRILRALIATRVPYLKATRFAVIVARLVCTLGVGAALFAPEVGLADERLYLVAVLFTFIFFAGDAEYRAVRRAELEDAQWRAVMTRFEPPILVEPPMLRAPAPDEPPILRS
jgi:Zn-dependent protease